MAKTFFELVEDKRELLNSFGINIAVVPISDFNRTSAIKFTFKPTQEILVMSQFTSPTQMAFAVLKGLTKITL